ncbi:MAG TPA: diguanylate cyclase [Candidatus Limnocylindrales bacterium]|nr:diguanylate cyclase [Candidatus Limnocylindrales bacterium]
MRLVGALGLVVPAALFAVLVGVPSILNRSAGELGYAMLAAVAAGIIGVCLTTALMWLYVRVRLLAIIEAAEHIAAGQLGMTLEPHGPGVFRRLGRAVNDMSAALLESHDAATVDRLTGVANRQALLAALFTEVERATRYSRPFSLGFIDIDHFKQVNDTYGHNAGDIVLRGVAQTVRSHLRATDTIGRYGGEEFMLLLTETGVDEAAFLAEKLRILIQRQKFAVEGNPVLSVTVSIGIAGGQGQLLRLDALVRDADAAMYSAKSLGRNQTYVFAEPDDDARVPRAPISTGGRSRAQEVGRAARDAAQSALTAVISPLSHYRGQPSALIASIVVDLARRLDLPEAEVDRIRLAALLHDIGKVGLPEDILEKPSSLTSAEWRAVVQHPRIGQLILEQATNLREAVPIILHHHERFSGRGYPYGLRGLEIPLGARIVAIADAYDAMTHDRPYKRAISHQEAIRELQRHAGTQFDPEVVQVFVDLYADREPVPDPRIALMAGTGFMGDPAVSDGGAVLPPRRRRPPPGGPGSDGAVAPGSDASAV